MKKLLSHFSKIKLFRYAVIGGISTLIHLGVASTWLYFVSNAILPANIAGFFVAYFFSYTMQSLHVFGHPLSFQKAIRYFLIQFFSLLASIAITELFTYNNYIKTFLVIVFMPLVTYLFHSFWTFKHKDHS
jgi:putative flippase GtrA